MADKRDMVKRIGGYSYDEEGTHVVYDSRNPSYGAKKKDLGNSEKAEVAAGVLNKLRKNSKAIKEDMGIWQGVTGGYGFGVQGQQSIEGLMNLKGMKNGSDVIVYDTEILGTAPMHRKDKNNLDFYTPTEIGFQHAKMVNGQLQTKDASGKALNSMSMLLRPHEDVYKRLEGLIDGVSNGKWTGMSADVRRTLSDLTLYGGDTSKLFTTVQKDGRRITSVNAQARNLHPMKGSVLSSSENIAAMRQGLKNLMEFGTRPEDAIVEMNHFIKGMQDTRFAGYNVYNFDQPMMMDYLNNQIGKHDGRTKVGKALKDLKHSMSLQQIDGLGAVRTLYRNTFEKYGDNVTLETMKSVFGMTDGQAHHALSDVNVTVEQLNRLLKDKGLAKTLASGGQKGTEFGRFNSQSIKVGDRLFGVAGMNSKDAGEYDGVYRKKNNKLVSAYDMKPNPIYRNSTYIVDRFFDGVEIDGKKMFGVQLYNENDDLTHTLFRSSKGELESAIHGHLEHVGRAVGKDGKYSGRLNSNAIEANRIQNEDRGMRRYRKMFSTESGGGMGLVNRMYGALDIARQGEKDGLDAKTIHQKIVDAHGSNTDEFVRDFNSIRGRLEGEEEWIKGFINRIENSPLKGTSDAQVRAQSLALAEFRKLTDNEFGVNETNRPIPNKGIALPLDADGITSYLQVTNADNVRMGLYSHLYRDGGRPSMGSLRKRYKEMLMQLKSHNAMDAKRFEKYYDALKNARNDSSIDNILGELANALVQARETNSLNGALKEIRVEDPTKVHRALPISKLDPIANQAIGGVAPYSHIQNKNSKKLGLTGKGLEVIEQHDAAVKKMLSKNNLNSGNVKSAAESLHSLVGAYEKEGFKVQLRYNEKNKGLKMVLADKDVAESVMNGSMKDIMKSGKTAVIDLAHINGDGTLTRGSQNRVARLKAQRQHGGGYEFITGFDEILGTLAGNAKTAKQIINDANADKKKNGMNSIHSFLNSRARKAMQNLSMNNRYGNPNDVENMFEVRSMAANWVRGGAIDVSDFAEDWYTGWYMKQDDKRKKLWGLQTPEEVKRKAQENKELFANSMSMNARRVFQREVDGFVNEQTGLNVGMHSVKDTHVSNYLRSNLDARQLLAFGYFNPMARENIMKTVNYSALDNRSVRRKLLSEGFSRQEVRRMTQRGVVSSTAAEVLEDAGKEKVSYLNMRAAYMDDKEIHTRATALAADYSAKASDKNLSEADRNRYASYAERLKNTENLSTWDGMMLMSDEAARAYETTREKKVNLSTGAQLTDAMKEVMKAAANINGMEFDLTKNMDFERMVDLTTSRFWEEEKSNPKKIRVSEIVKEDLARDAEGQVIYDGHKPRTEVVGKEADQVFDKWNIDKMKIKGWNAETQSLILEERVGSYNTTKFISDAGHRITGTMLPGEVIRDLAGGDAHAILPAFETSKKMYGTELSKFVSLAVDEAKAQIDKGSKLTVGQMSKDEALTAINRIMQESFGIDGKLSWVENGQIIVDDKIGTEGKKIDWKYSDINTFLQNVDEELGTDLSKKKTIFGNLGIGKQDVYDWENGIGLVDEHRAGLVKYGRKEVDMVAARANEVLGRGSEVVGWLHSHMEQAAKAQSPEIERVAAGLIRTVVEDKNISPDKGDVVIRTKGAEIDPATGRMTKGGTREISMHALNPLPEATAKDTKFVADDYVKTILDFGRVEGKFSDDTLFKDAIGRNGGTALLEMPDDTFSKKYVRLVDFGDITKGGTSQTPIMKEIQKIQQQLWRGIKEYQGLGEDGVHDEERRARVHGRIEELVGQYEDKAARMVTNARDDGLMKTFGSAKMDMSGRFRIQGVNPFANYVEGADGTWSQASDAKYKEGTAYMSRQRLGEMIGEKGAKDIATVMGLDIDGLKRNEILEKVLDNVNEKGLYGFGNRYPTIKQSTIQAMKFEIDDAMTEVDDRGMRLTVGTAQRLKADYDGDFMSTVLAHYSADNASQIQDELIKLHSGYTDSRGNFVKGEVQLSQEEGQRTVRGLLKDVENPAKQLNMTAGQLAMKVFEAKELLDSGSLDAQAMKEKQKFLDIFDTRMKSTLSVADGIETMEARLGKEFVGFIDNTRDKVLNLATSTIETLERGGKQIDGIGYRKAIEDFTAAFSQDLISSKKFSIEGEIARLMDGSALQKTEAEALAIENVKKRWEKVVDMNAAIMNPTAENIDLFKQHNMEVQLFDTSDEASVRKMNQALDMIQDVAVWNSSSRAFNNTSLLMTVSEGQNAEVSRRFLSGQGDMVVGTESVRNLAKWSPEEIRGSIERKISNWENSVLQNFDYANGGGDDSLIASLGARAHDSSSHVLSGATVADDASVKLRDVVSKFTPKTLGNGGGFAGGAMAFGAMWATSALVRSGPTPEGLQEQTQQAPVPKQVMQTPTARITENDGEYVNIRVSAKNAQHMSEQDVAALVHQEIGAMTSMRMDTTLNVNDNTQNIDQQWLQGVVANAINKGFGF